jgi:hypothetical protein
MLPGATDTTAPSGSRSGTNANKKDAAACMGMDRVVGRDRRRHVRVPFVYAPKRSSQQDDRDGAALPLSSSPHRSARAVALSARPPRLRRAMTAPERPFAGVTSWGVGRLVRGMFSELPHQGIQLNSESIHKLRGDYPQQVRGVFSGFRACWSCGARRTRASTARMPVKVRREGRRTATIKANIGNECTGLLSRPPRRGRKGGRRRRPEEELGEARIPRSWTPRENLGTVVRGFREKRHLLGYLVEFASDVIG